MSGCEHKDKKRIVNSDKAAEIVYKVVCFDCLELLQVGKDRPKQAKAVAVTDENRLGINELMTALDPNMLTEWEQTFHESLYDRWIKFKERTTISEKQQAILDRMQGKYLPDAKPALDLNATAKPVGGDSWTPDDDGIPF